MTLMSYCIYVCICICVYLVCYKTLLVAFYIEAQIVCLQLFIDPCTVKVTYFRE